MRQDICADLFQPLPTPLEMNAWDGEAVCFGIPAFTLMENAAREAWHALRGRLTPHSRVLVMAGGGNNGGDGYALARHLADSGHAVWVCHTREPESLRGAAYDHAQLARRAGVPLIQASLKDGLVDTPAEWVERLFRLDVVVDALLGTGFSGPARGLELGLIRHINALRETAFICSLDIPSGLDGLTGRPSPEAVHAHLTVTFEAAKLGLCLPESLPYTGELLVCSIGMPTAAREAHPASFRLFAPVPGALPKPVPVMHKGNAGRVMIIGGSQRYAGAPLLAGLGALRGGAGLVTLAAPSGVVHDMRCVFPELMMLPLDNTSAFAKSPTARTMLEQDALVLGPGIGRGEDAAGTVEALLSLRDRPPVVLDADGLLPLGKAMPRSTALCSLLRKGDIITPHPGEAAHLLGISSADVQADRPAALQGLCGFSPATAILKGAGSFIGQHGAPAALVPIAAPALAVGGSGDVLAGLAAALLARGLDSRIAACFAAHIHGRAGRILDRDYPARGNLAREIADALPTAMAELL